MKLKNLSLVTAALFILSLVVYSQENKRGTDLLAGSDFIKGLDINKIQKINLSFKDDKKITLTRDGSKFLLENHKSYPAATDKVNDLIFKIAGVQVKEKIEENVSEEDLKRYDLDEKTRKFLVEVFDNDGKKTVSFSVGKSAKGKGNYLIKEGKSDVYLSTESLWINSSYKDFINTVLLEIDQEKVQKIAVNTDESFQIQKEGSDFVLSGEQEFKQEKVEIFVKDLTKISFNDFYSLADPKIQVLDFNKSMSVELANKLIYQLNLAKENNNHYVKVAALINEAPKQFVVGQDDSQEDLQKITDVIEAQATAQMVNAEKGAWVYKISKSTYEKIAKSVSSFK